MASEPVQAPGRLPCWLVNWLWIAFVASVVFGGVLWFKLNSNRQEILTNRQVGLDLKKIATDQLAYGRKADEKLTDISVQINGIWYKLGQPVAPPDIAERRGLAATQR